MELNYGWLPHNLAILSIIVLGLLTNSPYEAVYKWVLSKKPNYLRDYGEILDYETHVKILFDYICEVRDKVTSFKMPGEKQSREFHEHLTRLRKSIDFSFSEES